MEVLRALDQEGDEWEDRTGTGEWVDSEGEWVEAVGEEGEEGEFVFETELGDGGKIAISTTKPYVGDEICWMMMSGVDQMMRCERRV